LRSARAARAARTPRRARQRCARRRRAVAMVVWLGCCCCVRTALVVPQALVLFRKMRKLGIKRSLLTYNAALGAVAHAGRWRASLHLLDEMKEADGLKPTRVRTIVRACRIPRDYTAMPPKQRTVC